MMVTRIGSPSLKSPILSKGVVRVARCFTYGNDDVSIGVVAPQPSTQFRVLAAVDGTYCPAQKGSDEKSANR